MEYRNKVGEVVEVGGRLEDSRLPFFALSLARDRVGDDFGSGWY
jgi:hypothetical protein